MLHCPLSGPDLYFILIIFCIIEYVTNKTLNLEEENHSIDSLLKLNVLNLDNKTAWLTKDFLDL